MEVPKTDLLHLYRAMKLFKEVIEESPELVNRKEEEVFWIAWNIVNDTQIRNYDYEDSKF